MAHTPRTAVGRERRAQIAAEAARLIAEHGGALGHLEARRKALRRLGVTDSQDLPGEAEIGAALRDHVRLFGGESPPDTLRRQREAALEAMQFLAAFEPRLTGEVLDASAGPNTPIRLLLHTDDAEVALTTLAARGLRWDLALRRFELAGGTCLEASVLRLIAGSESFELVLLPLLALRQPPLYPVDRRPMPRATAAALRRLLDQR